MRTRPTAAAPTTEEAVAADPAIQRAGDPLSPHGMLALQRSIGNAAVAALVARRIHGEDVPERPAATGADAWTETQSGFDPEDQAPRALQLHDRRRPRPEDQRGPDHHLGGVADMGATEVHEKLKAAKNPDDPGGTRLNYGELFKDGVLDVTFGVGYFEGNPPAGARWRRPSWTSLRRARLQGGQRHRRRGRSSTRRAARCRRRSPQFFVKQNAFSYRRVRQIHAIVRVVFNDVAGGGAAASAAFQEGMAVGDAVWSSATAATGARPTSITTHRVPPLRQGRHAAADARRLRRARGGAPAGRQGPVEGLPGADRRQDAHGYVHLVGNARDANSAPTSSTGRSSSPRRRSSPAPQPVRRGARRRARRSTG